MSAYELYSIDWLQSFNIKSSVDEVENIKVESVKKSTEEQESRHKKYREVLRKMVASK